MKKYCSSLREHATNIFKKLKIIKKVIEHRYYTCKYRGAAHNI